MFINVTLEEQLKDRKLMYATMINDTMDYKHKLTSLIGQIWYGIFNSKLPDTPKIKVQYEKDSFIHIMPLDLIFKLSEEAYQEFGNIKCHPKEIRLFSPDIMIVFAEIEDITHIKLIMDFEEKTNLTDKESDYNWICTVENKIKFIEKLCQYICEKYKRPEDY
jgi:hypothetical protein